MSETLDQNGLENLLGGSGDAGITNPPDTASAGSDAPEQPAGAEPKAAAWTSQLPKEIRNNAEVFSRLADFKSIGELANAYLKKAATDAAGAAGANVDLTDVKAVNELLHKLGAPKDGEAYEFEKDLKNELAKFGEIARGAMLTKEQAAKMLEGYRSVIEARTQSFLSETKAKAPELSRAIIDEFGADGAAWYKKAVEEGALNAAIARSGLGANKQLARALVLLGREMSEDYTPAGGARRGEPEPESWQKGARFDRK